MPVDCRKRLFSRIIVYDCEKDISAMEIQTKIIQELENRRQSANLPSVLVSCCVMDESTSNQIYHYLYWKGFCVSNQCHLKDEQITNKQWKEGKRWEDPFVPLQ